MEFRPGRANASKDLLELQLRAGGQPGVLNIQGRMIPVLRLAPAVFATDERIDQKVKATARLSATDIHEVGTASDFHFFLQRFRRFQREDTSGQAA